MKNMRKIYGTYLIKVSESTFKPKTEGSFIYRKKATGVEKVNLDVKIKSSTSNKYHNVKSEEFASKDEFIGFIARQAAEAWDEYEAEKQWEQEQFGAWKEYRQRQEEAKKSVQAYEKYTKAPVEVSIDVDDVRKKVTDIFANEEYTDSWKPYAVMKEVCGVDLIESPDIDDIFPDEEKKEAYIKKINSQKADPVNNQGVFRRVASPTAVKEMRGRPDSEPRVEGTNE